MLVDKGTSEEFPQTKKNSSCKKKLPVWKSDVSYSEL